MLDYYIVYSRTHVASRREHTLSHIKTNPCYIY